MDNKALYVLVGYDDETEKTLSGLQNMLYDLGFEGSQTKNIPMHFTLGSYDTEREEELKVRLQKAANDHKAFKVSFTQIDLFQNPANDVLFITPEDNKEMLSLKEDFSDKKDRYPWAAHTTMLIDKPEIIRDAKEIVSNEFKPFSGRVEKLYLYEFWPTRHIMTVQLEVQHEI